MHFDFAWGTQVKFFDLYKNCSSWQHVMSALLIVNKFLPYDLKFS